MGTRISAKDGIGDTCWHVRWSAGCYRSAWVDKNNIKICGEIVSESTLNSCHQALKKDNPSEYEGDYLVKIYDDKYERSHKVVSLSEDVIASEVEYLPYGWEASLTEDYNIDWENYGICRINYDKFTYPPETVCSRPTDPCKKRRRGRHLADRLLRSTAEERIQIDI